MIERKVSSRWREVCEAAGDRSFALRHLVRIREMHLPNPPEPRRAKGRFPSTNQGLLNREREEHIRVADVVVVEEILRARLERIGVQKPSPNRNRYPELMLFVAFSSQRNEAQALAGNESQQGSRRGQQWRRLIDMAVEAAKHPMQTRNPNRHPHPRACGVLGNFSREVRLPNAACQRQPRSYFEFVLDEFLLQASRCRLASMKIRIAVIVEREAKELAVMLPESVKSRLRVIFGYAHAERRLCSGIGGRPVVRGADRKIVWRAGIIGAVVVIEGRNRQQHVRANCPHPRKIHHRVGLMLAVAQPAAIELLALGIVRIRIVRNLIVVAPQRRPEPQLVLRIRVEYKRCKSAVSIFGIVKRLADRRLQAEIASIAVQSRKICEPVRMSPEIEFVVRLIKISEARDKFRVLIAIEPIPRDDVEDSVRSVLRIRVEYKRCKSAVSI